VLVPFFSLRTLLFIFLISPLFSLGTNPQASSGTSDSALWPLKRELRVTGNFCEARGRRFHAGIDLSIGGVPGADLISPVQGCVVRIAASWRGYGLQLLIQAEDGRQYLFAHLLDLRPDLEKALREEQGRVGDYHVVLHPARGRFPVERGETFARAGESGSGPAHLHFEVRDSLGRALNPMLEGFCPPDHRAPRVLSLALVPELAGSRVRTFQAQPIDDEHWKLRDTLYIDETVRLAIESVDHVDAGSSTLMPCEFLLRSASDTLYHSRLASFDFEFNRQSSGFYQRELQARLERDFVRLWPQRWDLSLEVAADSSRSIYSSLDSLSEKERACRFEPGLLAAAGEALWLELFDAAGNQSVLQFHLKAKGQRVARKPPHAEGRVLSQGQSHRLSFHSECADCSLRLSKRSFLEDAKIFLEVDSRGFTLGPAGLPLAEDLALQVPCVMSADQLPRTALYLIEQKDSSFVAASFSPIDSAQCICAALLSEPGRYEWLVDERAPRARLTKPLRPTRQARPVFVWEVSEAPAGLKSATLTLAGRDVYPRFEVDTDQLLYKVFDPLPAGSYPWTLALEDRCGNRSSLEGVLQRD
jgi:hypothetical protein